MPLLADAARPQWIPEGRHQEDLTDYHNRLTSNGYRFKGTTPVNINAARHRYTAAGKPDALINEYFRGGHTLTFLTGGKGEDAKPSKKTQQPRTHLRYEPEDEDPEKVMTELKRAGAKDSTYADLQRKLCGNCGSYRKKPGHAWCTKCIEKAKAKDSTYADLQRKLCGNCGSRRKKPGHAWCAKCIEKAKAGQARDIQGFEIRQKLGISEAAWNLLSKEERQAKAREAMGKGKDYDPNEAKIDELVKRIQRVVREAKKDGTVGMSRANLKQMVSTSGMSFANPNHFARAFNEALSKAGVGRFITDARANDDYYSIFKELNEIYRQADKITAPAEKELEKGKLTSSQERTVVAMGELCAQLYEKTQRESFDSRTVPSAKALLEKVKTLASKVRATDAEISGSDPKDHFARAQQYEIGGDRARALDSYRAAASGYRRAGDAAGEQAARDGVVACQSLFANQYQHPGAGRAKVCDSAATAARTAVERTRAGEAVVIVGTVVRPATARTGDALTQYSVKVYHAYTGRKKPIIVRASSEAEAIKKAKEQLRRDHPDDDNYEAQSAKQLTGTGDAVRAYDRSRCA